MSGMTIAAVEPGSWRGLCQAALAQADVERKLAAAETVRELSRRVPCADAEAPLEACARPGCPVRPVLVPPDRVPVRAAATREGRGALLHAVAHIEFNAVNLALDAAARFQGMPAEYYRDWIGVAAEEAGHFRLLRDHLRDAGFEYGDFPAHDGLWEMAARTAHDVLARMALVPRLLEARGLDAAPVLARKLRGAGDARGARILETIARDEVGHVAIGNRWFHWLCGRRGVDSDATFLALLREHRVAPLRRPLDLDARRRAGFSEAELALLESYPG
jgi:uncharacterized ferritin-like protein (DUF455 family)